MDLDVRMHMDLDVCVFRSHNSEIICAHLWCHLEWCQTLEKMDLEHWCQLEDHQTAFQPEDKP